MTYEVQGCLEVSRGTTGHSGGEILGCVSESDRLSRRITENLLWTNRLDNSLTSQTVAGVFRDPSLYVIFLIFSLALSSRRRRLLYAVENGVGSGSRVLSLRFRHTRFEGVRGLIINKRLTGAPWPTVRHEESVRPGSKRSSWKGARGAGGTET